ncbi:MAG: hypothetical protein IJF48_04245 [Clostridia bacterium]|nr:hypothetical protein [Clostridia bacterium]
MLKSILKIFFLSIMLTTILTSCGASELAVPCLYASHKSASDDCTPPLSELVDDTTPVAPSQLDSADDKMLDYLSLIESEFAQSFPEPNGITMSMILYSETYCELWQNEIDKLISENQKLAEDFKIFEAELNTELAAYAETFRAGNEPDAPYGREMTYSVNMLRSERLREWLATELSK